MALELNNDKGTYVASEWKDGTDDYTPITPARLNHMEQGIQANSEDIKTLGDSISPTKITLADGVYLTVFGSFATIAVYEPTITASSSTSALLCTLPAEYRPTTSYRSVCDVSGRLCLLYLNTSGELRITTIGTTDTVTGRAWGSLAYAIG